MSYQPTRSDGKPWHARLHDLMPFRVREILLVSSSYDAFILEEDGPLGERLFTKYSELNLSWSPRITHVSSGLEAMKLLDERWFDLVVMTPRLEDTDVNTFARMVKESDPNLPVMVIAFSEAELAHHPSRLDASIVDRCFLWTGDTRILITINKLVEDLRNIRNDTELAGVPVILVVEDSVRHYSTFLTALYAELMLQAQSLVAEGVNNLHKLLRMRTRPKVVHATGFEEAIDLYNGLKKHVFALVTDVRFCREGKPDPEAGMLLVERLRREHPDLPVMVHSAEAEPAAWAEAFGVLWVDKNSPLLSRHLRTFVSESLGFGEFVFRLPDRTIVARAHDMHQMEEILRTVPGECLAYHGSRNHFSIWLIARGMFGIADEVRRARLSHFRGIEDARKFLIDLVRYARNQEQQGLITDFSSHHGSPASIFVRLGQGSIGGKARGIAFANSVLAGENLHHRFEGLEIRIPKTAVVGTEEFETFIETNGINEILPTLTDDHTIMEKFLSGELSEAFKADLRVVWQGLRGPIAVRSSGLLEDLQFEPFSGVYSTYMLPNNHPDPDQRFEQLCQAIKAVYASTFCENARTYIASTPFRPEDEKMAITIQEMVGREYEGRFYPHISGVALSYNYYPIETQKPEDGTALIAVGLGQQIVTGGAVLRFCPASPAVLPQFAKAFDFVRLTQRQFYALDTTHPTVDFLAGPESSLSLFDIDVSEADGTLALAGSVYSPEDDVIRDNLKLAGPRAVTFNNILKWHAIPLAPALQELLKVLARGMGCALEIEFAVDMGDWGRPTNSGTPQKEPALYVLQIRPLATQFTQQRIDLDHLPSGDLLGRTKRSLGHGVHTDIHDIVYVKPNAVDTCPTKEIALQVGTLNQTLMEEKARFILVGPGRWGSSDPSLGVPVEWKQIAGAAIIAETKMMGREVEPSQGTHFFQNITSRGIGYLTVGNTGHAPDDLAGFLDLDWLDEQAATSETSAVRHVRFEEPLRVYLDGRLGTASILKPAPMADPLLPHRMEADELGDNGGG